MRLPLYGTSLGILADDCGVSILCFRLVATIPNFGVRVGSTLFEEVRFDLGVDGICFFIRLASQVDGVGHSLNVKADIGTKLLGRVFVVIHGRSAQVGIVLGEEPRPEATVYLVLTGIELLVLIRVYHLQEVFIEGDLGLVNVYYGFDLTAIWGELDYHMS